MARGKKTGGKDFTPGHSAPGPGRPPTPPELKALRRLTKHEFELISNRYLWASADELGVYFADPSLPAIEKAIVSVLLETIKTGDHSKIEWFLQRHVGKVKDVVEVETKPTVRILDHGKPVLELGHTSTKDEEDGVE